VYTNYIFTQPQVLAKTKFNSRTIQQCWCINFTCS